MMVDTGRYHIVNVKSGNLAVLHDGNEASEIMADVNNNRDGEKWNVTLLNNKKFTIRNHGHVSYAHCGSRSSKGDFVQGKPVMQQLVVKETRFKGVYTISPSDRTELFWGFDDEEIGTPLSLREGPTDGRNHWRFESATA